MINKYDLNFPKEVINKNLNRLVNQIWKLIPMKENGENYSLQLATVLLEIVGLSEIFLNQPQFLQIAAKLEGLNKTEDIEFSLYRKTVFEILNLIQELNKTCQMDL